MTHAVLHLQADLLSLVEADHSAGPLPRAPAASVAVPQAQLVSGHQAEVVVVLKNKRERRREEEEEEEWFYKEGSRREG